MKTNEAISILNNFKPFDENDLENDNVDFLYELTEKLILTQDSYLAIESVYKLIEKYPEADLGSPGPLVHFLEKFPDLYVEPLKTSLQRRPTTLTVWMLNRIINGEENVIEKANYLLLMRQLIDHPLVDNELKDDILQFIEYQENE